MTWDARLNTPILHGGLQTSSVEWFRTEIGNGVIRLEAEASIKILLFLHLAMVVLVTRNWFVKATDQQERMVMARGSVVFWLVSLVAVVAVMLLTAALLTLVYTHRTQAPDTTLFYAIMMAVGAVAAGLSGYLLNKRLKSRNQG